jgi:hypothetical protein
MVSIAAAPRSEAPSLLGQALRLAARSLAVFPCAERGKVPAGGHGFKDATTEAHRMRRWWRDNPNLNIGLATGTVSGVWVLDVDGIEGEAALRRLEAEHGVLPPTVEAITGGGGRHLYFRMPTGRPVRNSASKVGDHIDVRGDGGYVVAPPSMHPCGRRYAWSVDCASAFADAPVWLLDKAAEPACVHATVRTPPEDWRALVEAGATEGSRNDAITRLAGHLLRRLVEPYVVHELLLAWNSARCLPPLPAEEVSRAVNSICGAELRRRQRHG